MDDLESKLGAMMADPNIMAQVQAMAQNLGMQLPQENGQSSGGQLPPEAIQALSGLMSGGSTDPNQQNLLNALSPYLSKHHLSKLERAMRAAKMADVASNFLKSGR